MKQKKIVVIGGGTGTAVVLSGLRDISNTQLNAIVTTSDSGGSTGRLRDEFGFVPVGDLRQCLAALADGEHQENIRNILLYRFGKGEGLKGHNLGNLILTALEDLSDSPGQAIEIASQIFRIKGNVYPITEEIVDLVIEYEDGSIIIGEDFLNYAKNGGKKIKSIKLSPDTSIYPKAKDAIEQADLIILGPGDLYASILPNTLAEGFKSAIQNTKAKIVYIVNLMTHYSQTHDMTAQDHVDEISKYIGKIPDYVIINSEKISPDLEKNYTKNKEFAVINDLNEAKGFKIIQENLLSKDKVQINPSDKLPRSILRHDQKILAQTLIKLLK